MGCGGWADSSVQRTDPGPRLREARGSLGRHFDGAALRHVRLGIEGLGLEDEPLRCARGRRAGAPGAGGAALGLAP